MPFDSILPEDIPEYSGHLILTTQKEAPKKCEKILFHEDVLEYHPTVIRGLMMQKLNLPFEEDDEVCDQTFTETKTKFIRTETVYGVCGATYQKDRGSNQNIRHPDAANGFDPRIVITPDACTITQ